MRVFWLLENGGAGRIQLRKFLLKSVCCHFLMFLDSWKPHDPSRSTEFAELKVSCWLVVELMLSLVDNPGFGLRILIVKRGEAVFGV